MRWEFRDLDGSGAPADDDANLVDDLAETWSRPFIARLSVCDGACDAPDEPEDRFVAIFERHGRISGVLGFSQPRRVIQYRKLIAERADFDAALAFAAENP